MSDLQAAQLVVAVAAEGVTSIILTTEYGKVLISLIAAAKNTKPFPVNLYAAALS